MRFAVGWVFLVFIALTIKLYCCINEVSVALPHKVWGSYSQVSIIRARWSKEALIALLGRLVPEQKIFGCQIEGLTRYLKGFSDTN